MFRIRHANRIGIHGHRGSRGTHPENTFAAFEEAEASGADSFEIDTHLSADSIPMVFHDAVVSSRLCRDESGAPLEKPVSIEDLTAGELQRLDCGSILNPSFPEQRLVPGSTIPMLEEVFSWMTQPGRALGINIEIKVAGRAAQDPSKLTSKVLEMIGRYHLVDRVLLQSFDPRPLELARRQMPELPLSCLFEKETDFLERTLKVGAKTVGPCFALLTRERVAECHAKGIEVLPWTVNQEVDWSRLLEMDVDGIISDYPRKLVSWLGARHG